MKAIHIIESKMSNKIAASKSPHRVWVILLVALGMFFISFGQAIAAVKWHPGHYYELVGQGSKSDPSYLNQVYGELQSHPSLRGVVIRYRWGELEKTKGVYNFSAIIKRLSEVAAKKKRLIILLETKSSTPDTKQTLVPAYAKTAEYDGGIYQMNTAVSGQGYGTKLWDPQVRDRMIALIQALGKRFNNEPYFEGIGFSESAMGRSIKPITSAQVDNFYKNLLAMNKTLKASFPNTLSFQFLNYPRDLLPTYINTFKQNGSALGNPDVFLEDPGLHFPGTQYAYPGVYTYYPKLTGKIPLVVQVEKANYLNTRHDNSGYRPSVTQLLNFARDELQVNYLFWTRTPNYYPKVLELLNFKTQKANPSGGLKAACPSVYPSCVQ
ncbi:MAG TPA: glycoside hydrolase [Nitrosomonas sp.]|nr:glycoside hydrolase [Nitrosomonas sp.]